MLVPFGLLTQEGDWRVSGGQPHPIPRGGDLSTAFFGTGKSMPIRFDLEGKNSAW